jgi:hypothetical protein
MNIESIERHFGIETIRQAKVDPVAEQEMVDYAYYHDQKYFSYEEVKNHIHHFLHVAKHYVVTDGPPHIFGGDGRTVL